MKRILLPLILSLASLSGVQAQSAIAYTYDASGNRVLREPVRTRLGGTSADSLTDSKDRMHHWNVMVSPNPTKGPVIVTISSLAKDEVCMLILYDATGKKLLSMPATGEATRVDLSQYAPGYYMLDAVVDNQRSAIKIIRE